MNIIEFKDVSKTYDGFKYVLNNINFTIKKGELVFLTGKSGAGKSTLINLLTLRETITSGTILSLNFNLKELNPKYFYKYRRLIGVLYQDFNLIETLTIFENIALALEVVSSNKKLIKTRVYSILDDMNLIDLAFKYPKELSGGERQRVAFARAIINKPELFIADEPTGNLDIENAKIIYDSILSLNKMGATIIIATHDQTIVKKGKILTLANGELIV